MKKIANVLIVFSVMITIVFFPPSTKAEAPDEWTCMNCFTHSEMEFINDTNAPLTLKIKVNICGIPIHRTKKLLSGEKYIYKYRLWMNRYAKIEGHPYKNKEIKSPCKLSELL